MAVAKWATPGTRSSNLAGTTFNTLASGSAGAAINFDNSGNKDLNGIVTVKLSSLTPVTGGSITLRVYSGDGIDLPDLNGGSFESYTEGLTTTTGPKCVTFKMIRVYPFPLIFQVVNTSGVSFPSSGNEFYIRTFNEEIN